MPPSLRDRLLGRGGPGAVTETPPTPNGNGAPAGANAGPPAPIDPKMRVQPATTSAPLAQATQAEVSKIDPRAVRAAEIRLSAVDQLKIELHRKLIERLDLEALEQIKDEALLTTQIRHAVIEFLRAESDAAERRRSAKRSSSRSSTRSPASARSSRCSATGSITDILVNGPKDIYIERRGKLSRIERHVPRRRAPARGHRPHREPRRPARRRIVADGRRTPARRLARQRDHPAARARRPGALDPPVRRRALGAGAGRERRR